MPVTVSYTVQQPDAGTAILNACRNLANAGTFHRVTGLYAFASLRGAQLLASALSTSPHWRDATKRWVISIDGGITEPGALTFLSRLRRAEVRVPYAEELLRRRLRPLYRFHPKTLMFERQEDHFIPTAIMVTSANLTCSGLCFGHEHAMSSQVDAGDDQVPAAIASGVAELERIIAWAPVIDAAFIERYNAIRPAAPVLSEEFEDERAELIVQEQPVVAPLQAAALAAATHFWIEIDYVVANRGRHEEGNQIDMQRGSRVFFGFRNQALPRNSPIGTVRIRYAGHSGRRNLRFGNNSMDKLDLPIPGVDGPPSYSHQTLLFTRESPGVFDLSLGTVAQIAQWKVNSDGAGSRFTMRSGREFGVF